jgi:hypothetical protein
MRARSSGILRESGRFPGNSFDSRRIPEDRATFPKIGPDSRRIPEDAGPIFGNSSGIGPDLRECFQVSNFKFPTSSFRGLKFPTSSVRTNSNLQLQIPNFKFSSFHLQVFNFQDFNYKFFKSSTSSLQVSNFKFPTSSFRDLKLSTSSVCIQVLSDMIDDL